MSSVKPAADELSSAEAVARAKSRLDNLTKPQGSLGRLEELVMELAAIQRTDRVAVTPRCLIVFAADHGVASAGVSAYPSEVTRQMVANFVAGGAAASVLCRKKSVELQVIDVGVAGDPVSGAINARVRSGSKDLSLEAALTLDEVTAAIDVGKTAVFNSAERGIKLFLFGEMGIANTTVASALLSSVTGHSAELTVGRGTGICDQRLAKKIAVVGKAVARAGRLSGVEALSECGGLEIAAMVGAFLGCSQLRVPVIVDGFICSVAALIATTIDAGSRRCMIFAHRSAEAGHQLVLDQLNASSLLDLGLRLGEGSGALVALDLIDSAIALYEEMATFGSAGVDTAVE
jgi:nicotinate-nucleotide--dimethylbenzimidazole phosphoribosyltransferase